MMEGGRLLGGKVKNKTEKEKREIALNIHENYFTKNAQKRNKKVSLVKILRSLSHFRFQSQNIHM